jgi:hypothetical protein
MADHMTTTHRDDALRHAADAVAALTDPVFAQLDEFAAEVVALELLDAVTRGHLAEPDVDHLASLAVRAVRALDLVTGAGMAATTAGTTGHGLMHWWILREDEVVAKRHVLNPQSDSYYDFSNSRWFRSPSRRGAATLIAPYVDSWGTDDLTVTAALPAHPSDHQVTAIVAVDINARAYVQAAEEILRPAAPAVLVDTEGRAVASTEPDIETGVRLAALDAWDPSERAEVPRLGWSVIGLVPRETSP